MQLFGIHILNKDDRDQDVGFLSRETDMEYEKLKIRSYTHWDLYLHTYQYPYVGRCIAWAHRDDAAKVTDMTPWEWQELFEVIVPSWDAAIRNLYNHDWPANVRGVRQMVPLPVYQKVFAFDMMPVHLLRALLSEHDEAAEDLGCLELGPEDLALCTFACPSKIDYPALLRAALDRIEEAG